MGNLLIVDDETDILESLEELFRYESGLDMDVYTAKSATAAVKLLEEIKFDVVMTDIKMPKMNGITLYKLIKENWPQCRVIFLTGFRDFDDLYEISRYKDVRYLQKSEDDEKLIAAVSDAFREIEDMMVAENEESDHQSEIRRAEIVLRRNTMREFFWNTGRVSLTEQKLRQIKLHLQMDKTLFIFLLRMDHYEAFTGFEEEINREKLLCEIIEEFLPPRFEYYLYCDSGGFCLLFFQPVRFQENVVSARNWKRLYMNLVGTLEYIQEKALLLASLSISFVTCDDRCYLKDGPAYLNRLKYEAFSKIGDSVQTIIAAESKTEAVTGLEPNMPVNLQLQVAEMEHALDTKAYGDFIKRLGALTDMLCRLRDEYPVRSQELYYSIAIALTRSININHIKNRIETDISLDKLIRIEAHSSMSDASEYLRLVANRMVEELNVRGRSRTNDVLDKVVQYIDSHLSEDLTLTRLAEISYLNASYLSRIFKQKYDCNLTEYISRQRLDRARDMLRTGSDKINEIAVKVGYLSAPSFTRVFKKTFGIAPLEYRDRYGENNNEIQ